MVLCRCFVLLLMSVTAVVAQAEDLHIATYNIENLFDAVDDPKKRILMQRAGTRKNWRSNVRTWPW